MKKILIALLLLVVMPAMAEEGHEDPVLDGKYWYGQLVKLVNFLVIALAAFFILKKPIADFFQKRADQIDTDLKSAEIARREAETRLAEVEKQVEELGGRVDEIMNKAREEAEAERGRIINQAENEARKIKETAENEIDSRLKAARQELKEYAGKLAVDRAREIIKQELTEDGDREIIERSMQEIGGVH